MKRAWALAAVIVAAPITLQDVSAQSVIASYPDRPVKIVVPFPAGGPTDVIARFLGQNLSEQWKTGVVIENRPGANSAIGAAVVASAQPDGYTLLMAMDTTLVMNPITTSNLTYKVEDFTTISMAAVNTSILVVPAGGPKTVEELIAKGRANPGKLNYGGGIIPTRLAGVLFNKMAGIDAVFVPFKGSSDVVQGLLDGSIDYAVDGVAPHLPLIQDGKLRALAKLNNRTLASLPDLKPLSETPGLRDIGEMSTWVGVVAPTGTPSGIVDKVQKAVVHATQDKVIQDKLLPLGIVTVNSTPEEFATFVKTERQKWEPILRESGITMN
ncbi:MULTISPECIES: tripartite tricarboxylate transporter substrate binding protein [unclassified Beijerinckia]|uniref:Bug family tripartite tricarboxylate transporter substrate binding protein n=1 Tax=unclassified Beijerinckia TaxID=2638183 RepID=UPI00089846B1|nr:MULTISPECIES: tripartite tricarboxylate transporter substrate binding protein [unclassified Beijerinckia]MDH7796015.1 tripartite-type tricarboxylate transporter receptor subunit TctC [Beijerinckia sp. GAS462]SEC26447.1 Tripartite-type tricarboxylate transporter, receptor component TctC [Beijerinckia sp. 28-YEA-48]